MQFAQFSIKQQVSVSIVLFKSDIPPINLSGECEWRMPSRVAFSRQ
jgi:hypothetical protein